MKVQGWAVAWILERNMGFEPPPPAPSHFIFWGSGNWKGSELMMVCFACFYAPGMIRVDLGMGEMPSWNSIHLHCGTTTVNLFCAQGWSPGLYIVTTKLQVWHSRQEDRQLFLQPVCSVRLVCCLSPVDVRGKTRKWSPPKCLAPLWVLLRQCYHDAHLVKVWGQISPLLESFTGIMA